MRDERRARLGTVFCSGTAQPATSSEGRDSPSDVGGYAERPEPAGNTLARQRDAEMN
jgi:hypothetical protein